jgi:hypothetical protein
VRWRTSLVVDRAQSPRIQESLGEESAMSRTIFDSEFARPERRPIPYVKYGLGFVAVLDVICLIFTLATQ